ncbi:MAG: hypothetical protein AABZ84_04935 [Pseudomonadota bacterium]
MKWVRKILKSLRGIDTPIGGVSWEPAEFVDLEVNIKFPSDSGLQQNLEDKGYKISWCSSKNLQSRIQLEGWEKVVWEDKEGKQFFLKTYDGSVLIRRRE